jgi:phage FluMu protein Com
MEIDLKSLPEYRCQTCNKLLCKGFLQGAQSALEVKCRGCGRICLFRGKDAEIIMKRSVLIGRGLIPDTDLN